MTTHPHNGQHAAANDNEVGLAFLGAGITSYNAALRAIENGADPKSITIFEAANRTGGKIQTGYLADGTHVNMGAEFVDSDHTRLIARSQELGVRLVDSNNLSNETFQMPDGSTMDGEKFHGQFEPIAARIRAHKAEVIANPDGALAQQLNTMSMSDYITALRTSTAAVANPSLLRRFTNFVTGKENLVSASVATAAMQSFASEVGQPPRNINALSYLHEASSEAGAFLDSDCAYRVEGGTENIIKAMEAKLTSLGVRIEKNAKATHIGKDGERKVITFADGRSVKADKMFIGLPAYALGKIKGLENIGIAPELRQTLGEAQYTNSVKFTVKLNPGASGVKGNFFANHGMQVWSAGEGQMTFLVNADKLQKMSAPDLVEACKASYAKANGTTTQALFAQGPGTMVFNNPGQGNGCYASAKPGETRMFEHITELLDKAQAHGVAIAGTYLPLKSEKGIGVGFMECGVVSGERAMDLLVQPKKERSATVQRILDSRANDNDVPTSHVNALQQRDAATQSTGASR